MGFLTGLLKFTAGSILGAVVGAGVASLLAPQSGDELKSKIEQRIAAAKLARDEAERLAEEELKAEFRRMVDDDTAFRDDGVSRPVSQQ
jgi:gas vesicle protein